MTLSVTSATGALAALQALSLQTSAATSTSGPAPPAATSIAASRDIVGASGTQALNANSLGSVVDGIGRALTTADAADAAGQSVIGLLQQMRGSASVAADPATPQSRRAELDSQFQASAGKIGDALSGATVDGVNLIDGSRRAGLKAPVGDGVSVSLTPIDLTLGGSTLALPADSSVATVTAAASAVISLGGAIGAAGAALEGLQGQADQISAHAGAVQSLGLALASPGSGDGDGMRLLALQTGQQLSAQSSSIANQSPQAILSLFRS